MSSCPRTSKISGPGARKRYLLRAVPSADYRRFMRVRSPKWDTVTLPHAVFRSLVRPLHHFTHCATTPAEERPV